MKVQELQEQTIWEDDDIALTITESATTLQLAIKGKPGSILKDVDAIAKKGIQKAGIVGAFALDHLKRYKKFKAAGTRTIAFYARNIQERRAYERMIATLKKSGHFKVVRTFPYPGGGRLWEIKWR